MKRRKTEPFPVPVPDDPVDLFLDWYQEAGSSSIPEYNAMTLATSAGNKPSARIVLLKSAGKEGFVFFTNYGSRKGNELDQNPDAALVFYWKELSKQVRIEGIAEKLPEQESDDYFKSRPRGSQIAAWASEQSQVIPGMDQLLKRAAASAGKFSGRKIPRPPNWGGFRIIPRRIEFWIAGEDRLHERLVYIKDDRGWIVQRLAP